MNIDKDKLNFVIELTKRQLEFVKSSDKKDVNSVALGLFDNEIFIISIRLINHQITNFFIMNQLQNLL